MLRYGLVFWGAGNIESVFITQKRAVRIIFDMRYKESCQGVFKEKRIFTL